MSDTFNPATSLVESLQLSRAARLATTKPSYDANTKTIHNPSTKSRQSLSSRNSALKKNTEDDLIKDVMNLEIPRFDPNRKFEGLEKQKVAKKNRHDKAIEDFASTLDKISEDLEQDVLRISRQVREDLEHIDTTLKENYALLEDDKYLLKLNDSEILKLLTVLKSIISERHDIIQRFQDNLDHLEVKRAETVGKELKSLVDNLIAIAHKSPDEIEHIIESETYDLNVILTTNRNSHNVLTSMLFTTHVEVESETLQRWDNSRKQWRILHHNKALLKFQNHMKSDEFNNPQNRIKFMENIRNEQQNRHENRLELITKLCELNALTISKTGVENIQQDLSQMNEDEMNSIQECYNGLNELKQNLIEHAENRVEDLRHELHAYAALKDTPNLKECSMKIKNILEDANLIELWRQSPQLRQELLQLQQDLQCKDIVHNSFIQRIYNHVEIIISGFLIKNIFLERGRPILMNQIRNNIIKMKNVGRIEVIAIIEKLIPDLQEILLVDQSSEVFREQIEEIVGDMKFELDRIREEQSAIESARNHNAIMSSSSSIMSKASKASFKSKTNNSSRISRMSSRSSLHSSTGIGNGKTKGENDSEQVLINTILVKTWCNKLSILYFSSEIPMNYQNDFNIVLEEVALQKECNHVIDDVVLTNSNEILLNLDKNYKELIDSITNFLEAQSVSLFTCTTNLSDFYLQIAKFVENHRQFQHNLDEKTMDELWDFKEDHRFEREDKELLYENSCQKLRQSISYNDLENNFEIVLGILDQIQDCYRNYHMKSSYMADKHPLNLILEFKEYLQNICTTFDLTTIQPHPIEVSYDEITERTYRLNKKFIGLDYPDILNKFEPPPAVIVEEVKPVEPVITNESKKDATSTSKSSKEVKNKKSTPETNNNHSSESKGKRGNTNTSSNTSSNNNADTTAAAVSTVSSPPVVDNVTKQKPVVVMEEIHSRLLLDEETASYVVAPVVVTDSSVTKEVHIDMPWLSKEVKIHTMIEIDHMNVDDRKLYDNSIIIGFIPIQDIHSINTMKSHLNSDQLAFYEYCVSVVAQETVRKEDERQALLRPPVDPNGDPWTLQLEVAPKYVEDVVVTIRCSLLENLEREAHDRLYYAQDVNNNRKSELTDELEERLRTHWPRRGKVETLIKQPRAAELSGHEEKTYRHIQNIHERMKVLYSKFDSEVYESKKECDKYINEVTGFRKILNTPFKTLAALQGVEVKSRSAMLTLQTSSSAHILKLKKYAEEDLSSIKTFAMEFRKICPLQEPGKDGGYSELEIEEIEKLVNIQCDQIESIRLQWLDTINSLYEEQMQSLKNHTEFCALYETKYLEVSLSESLGQKYGAPRRRAQERLRTEVTRDEQSAQQLEDYIHALEVLTNIQQKKLIDIYDNIEDEKEKDTGVAVGVASSTSKDPESDIRLEKVSEIWALMSKIRQLIHYRAYYLKALLPGTGTGTSTTAATAHGHCPVGHIPVLPELPWISLESISTSSHNNSEGGGVDNITTPAAAGAGGVEHTKPSTTTATTTKTDGKQNKTKSNDSNNNNSSSTQATEFIKLQILHDVVNEVEIICKKETKELYTNEGKSLPPGQDIPESLQQWLHENREKLLGSNGYCERASKKLWLQIERMEQLTGRRNNNKAESEVEVEVEDGDGKNHQMNSNAIQHTNSTSRGHGPATETNQSPLGTYYTSTSTSTSPSICIRLITIHHLEQCRSLRFISENKFMKVVRVLTKGRELHERSLRPRLGSSDPDAIRDLAELNNKEEERASDLIENISKFRNCLILDLVSITLKYFENIGICSSSVLLYLDSCLHQEQLQVPPGMNVPKQHLSAKRLRKVQRLKNAIAQGVEDRSKQRVWPPVPTEQLRVILDDAEHMITPDVIIPATEIVQVEVSKKSPVKSTTKSTSSTGGASGVSSKNAEPLPGTTTPMRPQLMGHGWEDKIRQMSSVRGGVSPAHRAVVEERNTAIKSYVNELSVVLGEIRSKYDHLLEEEAGWGVRWKRQVELLRSCAI
eukprot:gene8913-18445_t